MELTVGKFLRFIVTIFFIFVIGWLIYTLSTIITVIIISALIAYILDPIASYLEAKDIKRIHATSIIFIIFFITIIAGASIVIPALFHELKGLQSGAGLSSLTGYIETVEKFVQTNFGNIELDLKAKIDTFLTTYTDQLLSMLVNVVSVISGVVIIPFIVFFFLKDGRNMKKLFVSYIPNRYFEMTLNVLHKIDQQLGGYLRGQFMEASVVGILSIIALWILNVKYFIIIGSFAGLANLIPYVGPVAGAIPAILITLMQGGDSMMIIKIIIAFSIVQFIDNFVVQPLVLSKTVNLHPLIIVFVVIIGGQFFGLLGMLLAVPVAGIIKVTSSELYNGIKKFNIL
jgi:putative permease